MPTSKRAEPTAVAQQEIRLATSRGSVAGLRWPVPGGPPTLAVHGWLDNAASFVPLAPYLAGLDLVAVDLPGHGHSEHRPPGANYYFTDYLFDIDAILDALGWDRCHLIGHSLGAAAGSVYAATAPERVASLTALDGLGPVTLPPDGTAARLRRSLESVRRPRSRRKPYPSLEAMIAARVANARDLDPAAARLICERAAQPCDGGFAWRFDPALYWSSPLLMTEEQALDCLRHITCPVLTLTALPLARWITEAQARARVEAVGHGTHEQLEGNHHFHMDQAETVGPRLQRFIDTVTGDTP